MNTILTTNLAYCALGFEYGSDEAIEAENEFANIAERNLTPDAFVKLESYWLKATTEEAIEYTFELLGEFRTWA